MPRMVALGAGWALRGALPPFPSCLVPFALRNASQAVLVRRGGIRWAMTVKAPPLSPSRFPPSLPSARCSVAFRWFFGRDLKKSQAHIFISRAGPLW